MEVVEKKQLKEGGRFLDRSDPVGLRKVDGLPKRDGLKKLGTWVPVRLFFFPVLLATPILILQLSTTVHQLLPYQTYLMRQPLWHLYLFTSMR